MASAEIRRQWRAVARAWRKLLRRRIKPSTAMHVFGRSSWKTLQVLSRLSLVLIGGAFVALLMIVVRVLTRLARSARR